jgi:hypothetical protein
MKTPKTSARALAAFTISLPDELLRELVDSNNKAQVEAFLEGLTVEREKNTYFFPVSDQDARAQFGEQIPHLETSVPAWRHLAAEHGYAGPILWEVREGFTLKHHAPKFGPCRQDFQYLQGWKFEDPPSGKALVFWIPRLLHGTVKKNVQEQLGLLAEARKRYDLPEHHLSSFGQAGLLAGLILAEFRRSGDRVPLDGLWTRTDTLDSDGDLLDLGDFGGDGLRCDCWGWLDDRSDDLGCFPLGVEELSS